MRARDRDMTNTDARRVRTLQVIRVAAICLLSATPALCQRVETVGSRALGMGGAFVAVASDSSATWWNPAGLATGPFVDVALGTARAESGPRSPADRASWFALATPPLGLSPYRFRITDIQPYGPTEQTSKGRQDTRVGAPARSLSASQWSVTVLRTITQGIHVGTTVKYVRGRLEGGGGDNSTDNRFDLDLGMLGVAGPLRIGALVRNVTEPEFGDTAGVSDLAGATVSLPRQVRLGVAFDAEAVSSRPLVVALDADARAYDEPAGPRQMVAVGAEHWFLDRRFGARLGGRVNTRRTSERTATLGASVAMRGGFLLEGHVAGGTAAREEGWGVAARVSF